MHIYDVIDELKAFSPKLKDQCQEIFDSIPFIMTSVRRTYSDGSVVWITSETSYLPNYFDKNIPLLRATYEYPTSTASKQGVYIWEESLPVINNSFLAGVYNVISGISLYEHSPIFSDVMAFAVDPSCLLSPFNLYASVLPILWKFRAQWYKDHGNFLDELHKKKLFIQTNSSSTHKALQPQELIKKFKQNPISFLHPTSGPILLKPEEALLIAWIKDGKTIHEIKDLTRKPYNQINQNLISLGEKIKCPFYEFSQFSEEIDTIL